MRGETQNPREGEGVEPLELVEPESSGSCPGIWFRSAGSDTQAGAWWLLNVKLGYKGRSELKMCLGGNRVHSWQEVGRPVQDVSWSSETPRTHSKVCTLPWLPTELEEAAPPTLRSRKDRVSPTGGAAT